MIRTLLTTLVAATAAIAQTLPKPQDLTGTWSSKSNKTLTGPGFYDPVNEKLIEPSHPGISYSFTSDGFFESAYYRAVANPTSPQCPRGIMQWQHGTWQYLTNGSLVLEPFKVDGRQLFSDPCESKEEATYSRYNQSELFQRYSVYSDPYHNIPRLDLFKFDGSPVMPLYLAFSPPQMLPTQTLNPTTSAGATGAAATAAGSSKVKRGEPHGLPLNHKVMQKRAQEQRLKAGLTNSNYWLMFGLGMTGVGSVLYFFF